MKLNQKGEGRIGMIIGFLILGAVIYLAAKVVPVAIHVFAFEDAVKEECKYLSGRKLGVLQQSIYEIGRRERLPVEQDDIEIQKIENNLRVDVTYTVPITFPGYVYNWDQHVVYEAPIF